jgi:hypothetical protein
LKETTVQGEHTDLIAILESQMPYSWDGLSRVKGLDSFAQVFHPEQEVSCLLDEDRHAYGVLRDSSLYIDGNDLRLTERLMSEIDTSSLNEVMFSNPRLRELAASVVRPCTVDNWCGFLVPNPSSAEGPARLLSRDDRDAVMKHDTSPAHRVGDLMRQEFEKQLQGLDARVFGILKNDELVSWLRSSPAQDRFWKVDLMWTREEHRRSGHCRSVLLAALNYFLERDSVLLITDVDLENQGALSVCKSVQSFVYANLTILQRESA